MGKKIGIQGIKGSNHYLVAREFFEQKHEIQEFMSFDALVKSLRDENSDLGIMAIENSIAGSIIPNYALIDKNHLKIVGEYYLNIHHHLMALPGQTLSDITEVVSHPMALLQCKDYLLALEHLKMVEDSDTAEVAKRIADNKLPGIAAIAPRIAAELYGLDILADDIQTIKNNATRFVVVQRAEEVVSNGGCNKASLKFMLDHKRGSLATVLNVMSDCKLNLTKIQSLPKIDTPWKYAFFVDVTFKSEADYRKAIAIIEIMADDFKILGEYNNGRA